MSLYISKSLRFINRDKGRTKDQYRLILTPGAYEVTISTC